MLNTFYNCNNIMRQFRRYLVEDFREKTIKGKIATSYNP